MPQFQRGNLAAGLGVTFGDAAGSLFNVVPYFWQSRTKNDLKTRWGREGNGELTFRFIRPGGMVTVQGDIPVGDVPPEPSSWIGQSTSLVITYDTSTAKTITFSVTVDTFEIDGVQKDTDLWRFTATCQIAAKPVYSAGWGDAVDGGDVTKTDSTEYGGAITVDPATVPLQSSATVTVDWWGLTADTDTAVIARLTAIIAAQAPPLGKKRPSIINQDAPDGGTVTLTYGLTDTNDDVVLPRRTTSIDQSTHPTESTANSAALNGTPPTPTGDDFVKRRSATIKLNDGATQSDDEYGPRSIEQDKTFPESPQFDDVSDLGDTEQDSVIESTHSPAAAPSGLKYIGTRRVQQTDSGFYQWTDYFALRTPAEQIEFEGSPDDIDASSLSDAYSTTHHESSSTPSPADPADGFVYRGSLIIQVNPADTVEKWRHRDNYARITHAKEVEFEGTRIQANSTQDIGYTSTIRIVSTEAAPPTPLSDPAGDWGIVGKLVYSDSQPMTTSQGAYTGFFQHTFVYGPNDRYDEIVNQGFGDDDPADFGDAQTVVDTASSSTFPGTPTPTDTNLKLIFRSRRRKQVSPEIWEFTWKFGRMTETDRQQLNRRTTDPDDFGETERIPIVASSRTVAPSTPSQIGTASNAIDITVEDLVVANSSFTGLYLWIWNFGPTTKKQEIEQQGGFSIDSALLEDDDVQTLTNTSSTPPATPDARVTGQVLYLIQVRRIQNTPAKWEFKFIFRYRTSADELVADATTTNADTSALESTAETSEIWLVSGGAPSPPTLSGFVLRFKRDRETKNPLYRQRIYTWGLRTTQQDIEFLESRSTADVGNVAQNEIVVKVLSTATPVADDTYNPDTTNLEFYTSEVHEVTASKYVHIYTFRPLSPIHREQESFKEIIDDPVTALLGDDKRCIIDANATTAAPAVSGQVCVRRVTQKIGRTLYKHTFYYGFRSIAAGHVAERTTANIDVSGLESEAFTAEVYAVSGAPAGAGSAPYSGLVNTAARHIEIENPAYQLIVYSWALVTNQQRQERERTRAEDDPLEGDEGTVTAIVSSASALATYIEANIAASDNTYGGLEVQAHPTATGKYLVGSKYVNKDTWYEWRYYIESEQITTVGNFVYVAQQYQRGTGLYQCRIAPFTYLRTRGELIIHRRIYSSSALYSDTTHGLSALWKLRNNATFLGVPTGQLMFIGASGKEDHKRSGAGHVMLVDYYLKRDDLLFQDQAPEGWYTTTTSQTEGALNATSAFPFTISNPSTTSLASLLT